jgi:Tripartite tricarboxylate transporter family receptor
MAWGSTARPLNWGFGCNAGPHLLGDLFVLATGIDVNRVPYRGGADAVPDTLGRRVQVNSGTIEGLSQLVREGQLRALVVTGETRCPSFPDVPTMTRRRRRFFDLIQYGNSYVLVGSQGGTNGSGLGAQSPC